VVLRELSLGEKSIIHFDGGSKKQTEHEGVDKAIQGLFAMSIFF